jgi:hypothetical protein
MVTVFLQCAASQISGLPVYDHLKVSVRVSRVQASAEIHHLAIDLRG